jgi:hypothetical protein
LAADFLSDDELISGGGVTAVIGDEFDGGGIAFDVTGSGTKLPDLLWSFDCCRTE